MITSLHGYVFGQATVRLFSPDKRTVFAFEIRDGKPGYSVLFKGRKMIDFGNLLRHAYHTTDVAIVSDIVHNELPALKTFVSGKLSSLK